MQRPAILVLLGSAALVLALWRPVGAAENPSKNIDEILEVSGLRTQIQQVPVDIKSGFLQRQERSPKKFSPKQTKKILEILTESYDASALEASVVGYIEKRYDADLISTEIRMLSSPLNQQMTRLESEASTPEGRKKIQEYAATLKDRPPPPERTALLARLDRATGTTEIGVELLVAVSMAYIEASDSLKSGGKRLDSQQLNQMADQMRKVLWTPVEDSTMASFLYIYRDVPDEELKAYTAVFESETSEWFRELVKGALTEALSTAAQRAGSRMAGISPESAI